MRLAILILLLIPAAAHAAPVIYGAIEAFGFITTVAGGFFGYAALALGVKALGDSARRRQERAARDAYNASLQDRTITNIASETPYRYVYGRARVGSAIIAIFTSGDKDQYKHLVCVHAAHECDAIEEIYIQNKALGPLDADGNVTSGDYYDVKTNIATEIHSGTAFSVYQTPDGAQFHIVQVAGEGSSVSFTRTGKDVVLDQDYGNVYVSYTYQEIHSRVRVQKHLGTDGDAVDAYLHGILPTQWPSTATVDGFCYTVVTLDLNQPEFQSGIPPIEVLLRGKKLYDPRTETTYWSQNPALAIYDYQTSELCGVDSPDIPIDYLIAAANACDELVASAEVYGELGPRYTLNGVVTSDQAQQDVLEKMAQAMAGGIVSTTWEMWAGTYVAPVMSLYVDRPGDMGDVVGQIAITPGVSDADLYNGVKGQYISSDNSYVATDFEPYHNSTYVTADGVEKWTNIDFPFTDKKQRVWNLARIFTEDQRNGYTVRAEFSLKAWSLKVGQRITLTSTIFGWDNKVFRVIGKKFSPTMPVELTLKEDASSIWDFVDEALPDATPNTNLPNPFAIDMLSSLTCESGDATLAALQDGTIIARIKASWPQATTQAVFTNGLIEIEFQRAGNTTWQKTTVSGSDTEAFLTPVEEGRSYVVRARAVNPYFNVKSDWMYAFHRVVAKSARPPNVTGFGVSQLPDATRQFSWTVDDQPVDVLHGGGYLIKYRAAGDTTAWADMTALHTGLLTQSPFETGNPAAGSYDFAISSIDGSGNESADAAMVLAVVITDDSTASAALAAAEAAQADANTANTDLANIASDNVLSKGEKPKLIADVNTLLDEFVKNRLQADAFSVSRTDYDTAIWRLYDYLGTLAPSYDNLSADTAIDGALLRQKFASAYLARQIMLNAISTKASTLATWSGVVSASGKLSTSGDIFNSGAVGTDDLTTAAATDVIKATASNVAISFYSSAYTSVASISYTAEVTGIATLTVKGTSTSASVASPASVVVASPAMKITGTGGLTSQVAVPAASFDASSTAPYNLDLSMNTAFQLTAGTAYTFDFELVANSNKYQCTVSSIELVLEAIKR